VPAHTIALERLASEIESGVVSVLGGVDEDVRFDAVYDWRGKPWTALPWYLGEAWLYARIRAAVGYRHHRRDPFRAAKAREEAGLTDGDNAHDPDPLASALWRSLWGNRGDLSLPSAKAHTQTSVSELLVDNRDAAIGWLRVARHVVIMLDNAGGELFADLQLARALADRGVRVTLLAKDVPYFVSDALPADVFIARRRLARDVRVDVVTDPYMTGPGFLHTSFMPPRLRSLLTQADVVIAKGDCTYRRLTQDAPYRAADVRAFDDVVDVGARLVCLRTLKAEVLVGASVAACEAAAAVDHAWLTSGRFGVVQCVER